jgi:hypothetical protein
MCRLFALASKDYVSPTIALKGLVAMREGYDGSGFGMLLKDLGGPFENMKDAPILSGIFTSKGLRKLDYYMLDLGFTTKYKITFKLSETPPPGVPKRDIYLIRAYDYPSEWDDMDDLERHHRLMLIRLKLKEMGTEHNDIYVFSLWPDTILIKEVGDPADVSEYLGLNHKDLMAKIILMQGRQNTNHAIDLYACHPFFLQGFSTMTNGENTAFLTNREYLISRGFPAYDGYMSDSEVFTHTLHFCMSGLKLGIEAYKHIITPLMDESLEKHPNSVFLKHLKHTCRNLIIDGPNCIIGCLPDNTLFMVQDRKKLRPGVIGGNNGMFVLSSEVCALDAVIPERDKRKDFQPMHLDTITIDPKLGLQEVLRQTDPLPLFN